MTLASATDLNTCPAFSARAHAGSIITKQENAELRVVAGELSHRIKNLVAVIQSIARQTIRQTDTKEDFEARFSRRLSAFGHSLDLLIANDWRGARVDDLVRLELAPFGLMDRVQISTKGPPLVLSSVAARNIGLALHELATNASKFGALSVPEGEVAVHWALASRGGEKRFHMTWWESGGPIVTEPTRRGFGRQLIQHVPAQALGGKLTYEFLPAGVRWTLDIPAAIAVANTGNGRAEALQPMDDVQTRDMAYASGVGMREDRRRYE
jgi:two-component sensor histidine kinase